MTVTSAEDAVSPIVLSIGYEGRDQQALIAALTDHGIHTLVDVRLTPLSRKPGLSKTALSSALREVGIGYIHFRELGNPPSNRKPFRTGDVPRGVAEFKRILETTSGHQALGEVAQLARTERIAVLCYERSHDECHRQVVIEAVARDCLSPVVMA